jgi:hypothetical protein
MNDTPGRRPRWEVIVFFPALLALVASLAPLFKRPPAKGIPIATRARFDLIESGMTEPQVEDLLGGPRGIHDRSRLDVTVTSASGWGSGSRHLSWWYFPDTNIEVGFDEDGRVDWKRIEPLTLESPFEKAVVRCKQVISSLCP